MKGLEAAVLEAIAEERRDDQPLDRSVLLNGSMPRTKAALNAYAHRVAAVLDNPTGWTTFRRYLAGDFAEGGAAPSGFRTSLGDVLRNWHNGIVETTPARYFTGMLSGAERWRLVQSPPPGWVRPEVWGYSRENTWKNNNNGDELAMRWVSEDNRRGMFYSLTDGRIYEFDLPRQTDGNGQQTRQQARKGR